MAVTYGFYNSYNGDRKYDANDFDQLFDGIISDGVFATIGDGLAVIAGTGMQVVVKSGKAWFNRTWTLNDAQLPLPIAAADTLLNRIDAVVLEVDTRNQTRANSIKIVQGTASANAQKPNLVNSGGLYQHPLAYVTINKNAASITNANIESNIGKSGCEYVTGVIETISIDDLFKKWQGEFDAWFGNVKAQLSGSVAENLQRQITQNADDIKKKADTSRVEALETWKGEFLKTGVVYKTGTWSRAEALPGTSAEVTILTDPNMILFWWKGKINPPYNKISLLPSELQSSYDKTDFYADYGYEPPQYVQGENDYGSRNLLFRHSSLNVLFNRNEMTCNYVMWHKDNGSLVLRRVYDSSLTYPKQDTGNGATNFNLKYQMLSIATSG